MRRVKRWLAIGLATCLAVPALAQTALTPDNSRVTNTIGASGEGENNNGRGNANFQDGVWEVNGGGDDLWSTACGMTFVHTALEGDGNITARILEQRGGHGDGWERAGVLIREDDTGPAMYAGIFFADEDSAVPRGRHLHSHWRFEREGPTVWGGDTGPYSQDGRYPSDGNIGLRYFPLYMRVQRQGNVFTTFRSDDGRLWEQCTRPQAIEGFPSTARAGIFASSHGGEQFARARFDNVSISREVLLPGPPFAQAIAADGAVLVTWTAAPGADGHNVYRRIDGETEFKKLTPEPTKQNFFADTVPNGQTARYIVTGVVGGRETAGSLQQPATPSPPIQIGNANFFSQEIDTKWIGSTRVVDGNLVITAGGAGIGNRWGGQGDAFRFVAAQIEGNATLTAQIAAAPRSTQDRNIGADGQGNGGVGLMVREGLAPSARFGMIRATFANGVQFRGRSEANVGADIQEDGTPNEELRYPLYLRIQRAGDVIRGFESADGRTFTQVGEDLTLSGLRAPVYIGFAVTNSFEGFTATATIPMTSIRLE